MNKTSTMAQKNQFQMKMARMEWTKQEPEKILFSFNMIDWEIGENFS